jgi:hypothetical protein
MGLASLETDQLLPLELRPPPPTAPLALLTAAETAAPPGMKGAGPASFFLVICFLGIDFDGPDFEDLEPPFLSLT